jgi:eukaryotic-like serine/threonine-protein kinase
VAVATVHRIGPFEVIAPLGAGGMGEVFRARDPRIGREVAIKVLPAEYARDPDRLRRFEREARAAGSLSHPNLVTIFELGTHDGSPYLAMELLDGATLRRKLQGRIGSATAAPFTQRTAIEIAIQIASGLAAAHEKGLVHRDLKPENVFITRDGFAKILDFGIVKLAGGDAIADSLMPTAPRTSPGMVVGTAGYMSPEQVAGAPVDHRSDIFSLGAVLYEMLSGHRAFQAPTSVETMNAILHQDPPPLDIEGNRVSPVLERIVRRCLEKEPRRRFDSAHDLTLALEAAAEGTSGSAARVAAPAVAARKRTVTRAITAAAVLAVAAIAFAAFWLGRETTLTAPAPAKRTGKLVRLTWEPGNDAHPTVSPDGASFAFARGPRGGDVDIYLQRIGGENATNLTPNSPGEDTMPAFSPDGTLIAFRSSRDGGGIFVMGATGESVRRLTDVGFEPAWSPDGKSIAFATDRHDTGVSSRNSEIWIVDVATGKRRKLFDGDGVVPSWAPSGKRLAFFLRSRPGIVTIAASGGPASPLTEAYALTPEWTRDGIVFGAVDHNVELWRVKADDATGAAIGEPEPLIQSTVGTWMPSSTPDGRRLLFSSTQNSFTVTEHAFDPARGVLLQQERTLHSTPREFRFLLASPDKEWLCFLLFEKGRQDLMLVNTRRSETRRLTDDALREQASAWSPDGSKIYFFVRLDGETVGEIWSIAPDGSGRELVIKVAGPPLQMPVLAPDGRTMYVLRADTREAFAVDLTLPVTERRLVPLPRPEEGKHLSLLKVAPDGRSIVGFAASANGELDRVLWLFDVESRTYRRVTDLKVAHSFQWLPDSKRVLLGRQGELSVLDVRTGAIVPAGNVDASGYLSTDGRSLFIETWKQESDIWMLDYGDAPSGESGTKAP